MRSRYSSDPDTDWSWVVPDRIWKSGSDVDRMQVGCGSELAGIWIWIGCRLDPDRILIGWGSKHFGVSHVFKLFGLDPGWKWMWMRSRFVDSNRIQIRAGSDLYPDTDRIQIGSRSDPDWIFDIQNAEKLNVLMVPKLHILATLSGFDMLFSSFYNAWVV